MTISQISYSIFWTILALAGVDMIFVLALPGVDMILVNVQHVRGVWNGHAAMDNTS